MKSGAVDPPSAVAMRAARRRWAGGVTIMLTRAGDGWRGATVSAFLIVSLTPPRVLVCLDREGSMAELVMNATAFTVSILDRGHEPLAERFAGRGPLVDPRLSGVDTGWSDGGLPVLANALAWFACTVATTVDGGDHLIIVGDVSAVGLGEETDDPLLYYEGRYRAIEAL